MTSLALLLLLALGPDAEEPGEWTLAQVLDRIATSNPTIGQAQANVAAARAVGEEARRAYIPGVSFGLNALRTDNPAQAFALLLNQQRLSLGPGFDPTPGSIDNWHKEVRLQWALFAPGRGASRDAAETAELAADLERQAVERRLLNAGLQTWLALRAALALESVARDSSAVVERRLELTRVRHREGAALRSDVLLLEVRLAESRRAAADALLQVRTAQSQLRHLMALSMDAPLELAAGAPSIGADLPEELDELLERAATERRDLMAAEEATHALELRQKVPIREWLPTVSAFGSYEIDGTDLGIDTDLDSYTLGLDVRLSLTPASKSRVRQAAARIDEARERYRQLLIDAQREVHDAWYELQASDAKVALAAAAVSAAEEAYRIVAAAQDAGAATVVDVLEADDARNTARVEQVATAAQRQMALAKLVAATGGIQ